MTMEIGVDHYSVLGMVWDGRRSVSEKEIEKAYRLKARKVHPDKRFNDPEAHSDFISLQSSYALLKDEEKRRAYESQLKLKFTLKRKREDELKIEIVRRLTLILRRKEEEERLRKQREEEEQRLRKQREEEEQRLRKLRDEEKRLRDDIERIKGLMEAIGMSDTSELFQRTLIISDARGYTCAQLTELFQRYGVVKRVKIIEKIGSALLEMSTKEGFAAALSHPPIPGVSYV